MAAVQAISRMLFHSRTGSLVTLSNGNRTAQRNHPGQEFNNGVVISAEPLSPNQLFEVRIDRKLNSWSGSIEVGVTTCNPATLEFPTSATGFREGTWTMSGTSIMKDGHTVIEEYGADLDQLSEGDRVGVMRAQDDTVHFYVNGVDQGVAATGVPEILYAVIDLYGKCAQVTVVEDLGREQALCNEMANEAILEASAAAAAAGSVVPDQLCFHEKCGSLVKLSNKGRVAERRKPMDEFNNGVVMTNRPLRDDEMFEIRLDQLVDKWSGSIEVGITTHNPSALEFPATMTNMRSGKGRDMSNSCTIMMSGCGILTNGKGTRREYGEFNLDELSEGDHIGLMRKSDGSLHYYINGIDQGVAATNTPRRVWGVVDLYGMAVKVTIVDRENAVYPTYSGDNPTLNNRTNNYIRRMQAFETEPVRADNSRIEQEHLLFHPQCGRHAAVINYQRTAHRPNAVDDFNNGVVLTNRHLNPNELFEVVLDKMVDKWAGSIEIGVTTHSPTELDYPSTMTNIRSGTWMMTGTGVMHNGTNIVDEYGQNLDRLRVGDRVGVMRKADGTLHFFVNGIDQGQAATGVPANVYGVIDLYGQAAQATIVDQTLSSQLPTVKINVESSSSDELFFHHLHGRNATITNNGKTACRPRARDEFNDAIVMSNRPLKDNELFEVSIDKMVDRWSGAIEAGVTLILPEELDFPNTMTDIDYDTWMLSGSAIMQDGSTIRNGYRLDLDTLQANCRIGMMRCSDGTLHYYQDGVDMGVACTDIPSGVYAVIDLYGQCAQVTITSGSGVQPVDNHITTTELEPSISSPLSAEVTHRFSQCCGKNVTFKNNGSTACRVRSYDHGLLFSADPLRAEELFEVQVEQISAQWSGSIHIGLTSMAISESTLPSAVPKVATELRAKPTWIVTGSEVKKNGVTIKENYAPCLERIEADDRVGVKLCMDGTMHVVLNGEDLGVAATNIPKNVFAVIDMYGMVDSVTVVSSGFADVFNSSRPPSSVSSVEEFIEEDLDEDTAETCFLEFHASHGKNIELSNQNLTACRTDSYNQAIVLSHRPLIRNHVFKVRIDKLNPCWTSSLAIGIVGFSPDKWSPAVSAISIKKSAWVIHADSLFHNGLKVKDNYGPNLDSLSAGHTVGVMVDGDSCLHLLVNNVDQGIAARDIPATCYGLVDLYGQCEQVTMVTNSDDVTSINQPVEYREKADMEEGKKEKTIRGPEISPVKNCEYQNMCSRFVASLGLPEGYFNSDNNQCYCETCHKIRGDDPYYRKGEPPKECALPFGWCKFGLRIPLKAEAQNIYDKWHMAYCGTQPPVIRKILDTGDLHVSNEMSMVGHSLLPSQQMFDEKGKPEEQEDIKPIQLSPSIKYAGCQQHAPRTFFRDHKTKRSQYACMTFQVYVKPGSYKVGSQTIAANEQIDPRFNNNEVEWTTKERGATVLSALVVKIE